MVSRIAATWFLTRVPNPSPKSPSKMVATTRPGTTAPSWPVTWEVTPPRAAFHGRPSAATTTSERRAISAHHHATTTTLAPRTRARRGMRTRVEVMVLCRYSLVMQMAPSTGARNWMPKYPAPRSWRRSLRVCTNE